jgi:chaperone required for assembly of F1-ATPase
MKRFYKQAAVVPVEGGHGIALDGKPVRTPGRAPLALPSRALAELVAQEWEEQGEEIRPAAMPSTGISNAAIDHVLPDPNAFASGISAYGRSDLLCYRADGPGELIERQARIWDPLLEWAAMRYDVALRTTTGILPVDQPPATLARLEGVVAAFSPFVLAPLSTMVTLTGSLIACLALLDGGRDVDAIWDACDLDERWQAELWGEDAEAATRTAHRRAEFETAARYCLLAAQG